jgi:hypothetical protein
MQYGSTWIRSAITSGSAGGQSIRHATWCRSRRGPAVSSALCSNSRNFNGRKMTGSGTKEIAQLVHGHCRRG